VDKGLVNFIRDKRINSFSKLRFLLFLYQNPRLSGCAQQLAERLYVEVPLVEKIVSDLQAVGLLEKDHNCYTLCDEPGLKGHLENLVQAFEHPLTRQELLEQVRNFSI
jgi:hypothetical protein